jgi:hypothetical protein
MERLEIGHTGLDPHTSPQSHDADEMTPTR